MSAPTPWWQLMLGIFMSLIFWHYINMSLLSFGVDKNWSMAVAVSLAFFNTYGFYFLLEAAMMEHEGKSIKLIYKEFFGEKANDRNY